MTHDILLDHVRKGVEFRLENSDLTEGAYLGDRILLGDGHYVGRLFEWENSRACWFFEEEQVKVYDGEGRVMTRVAVSQLVAESASQLDESPRRAA